jgi:methyl-accepting chemotaxis protein
MKSKKLMTKILLSIGIPVAIIYVITTVFITQTIKQSVSQLTENDLTSKSQSASYQIDNYFSKYINIVEQLKRDSTFQNFLENTGSKPNIQQVANFQQINNTINNTASSDKENIINAWIADTTTNHLIDVSQGVTSYVISSRPWYKTMAAAKKTVITDPYEDVSTKALTVSIITPYYKNGGNTLTGVIGIDITLNRLYNTIKNYKLGNSGFYILTSSNNQLVYYPDESLKNKSITASKMSSNVIQGIQAKKSQFLSYTALDKTNYGYISNIGDTGWTVATGLPSNEFFSSYQTVFASLLLISIVALGIIIALIVVISKSITNPLIKLKGTANKIADGNLDVLVEIKSSDEVGQVAEAISRTVDRLKQYIAYIDEVSAVLDQIAAGNLAFDLHCDYVGKFSKIKASLENIKSTLISTVSNINVSADQVAAGSEQVSNASQILAQGATEQASSLQELSASVTEISHDVKSNAKDATNANDIANSVVFEFKHGNELMQQMMNAMSEINTASGQISKIIKVIQDIAFQTNILALNAAVEAARAGEAGRGFSVVAEEVRNLAGKSAEAAKSTSDLVQKEIQSVQNGSKIAAETSQAFGHIVDSSNQSADLVKQIAEACEKQSASIQQVNEGLNQISSVVQSNSATSEESAASSEELNGQAQSLKTLIQHFKTE